jgi:hypothetical protein
MLASRSRLESGCRDSKAAISYRQTFQSRRTIPEFGDMIGGISPKVRICDCLRNHPAIPYIPIDGQRNSKQAVGDEQILVLKHKLRRSEFSQSQRSMISRKLDRAVSPNLNISMLPRGG